MAEITLIETQKKNKNRCNLYIDGRFYCGINLETAMKYSLKAGTQIDEAKLVSIISDSEKSEAFDKALSYISFAPRTKKQMCDYLAKNGYINAIILSTVEKLEYYNYLNDVEYCKSYISSTSGKGKRLIEAELLRRGAQKDAIDDALADFEESDDEAQAVLKKYMRGKRKEDLHKGFKYLLSKGYSYDTAKSAVESFGCGDEDY